MRFDQYDGYYAFDNLEDLSEAFNECKCSVRNLCEICAMYLGEMIRRGYETRSTKRIETATRALRAISNALPQGERCSDVRGNEEASSSRKEVDMELMDGYKSVAVKQASAKSDRK